MPDRKWRDADIPQSVIDFEQKLIDNISHNVSPPLGHNKTMENPTMVANVLKELVKACEDEGVTHLPVAKLKLALGRWW